jgi:hypothetical protein
MRRGLLPPGPVPSWLFPVLPAPEIRASRGLLRPDSRRVGFPARAEFLSLPGSPLKVTSSRAFPMQEERRASSRQAAQVVKVAQSRWALDQKQSARMRWNRGRRLAVFS